MAQVGETFVRIRPDLGDLARLEALLKDLGDALTRYREACEYDDQCRRAPACPNCGMTAQVEPSRTEPGRWMCHGCAQLFDLED